MTTPPPRLKMEGVAKRFGATQALRQVDLTVAQGEVHALIGENGAGKSTLMKILSGAHRPDSGRTELDGRSFVPADPLHARRCGIAMIYQELNLAPHLSVEENILLGQEPARWGWIHQRARREKAQRALDQLSAQSIRLDWPVQRCTIGQQQIVEIARALVGQPKVLIMDEPTSSLTQIDIERLFDAIRRLKESGVSIIYISHFLEECQTICDRFTVLRDGETVGTGDIKATSLDAIIRLMVGREMKDIYPQVPHAVGPTVLQLQHVAGRPKPRDVSLQLRQGEILGLAGLVGAGRTETVRACFGLDRLEKGQILVYGQDLGRASPADSLGQGMGLLSENRKEEGLMLNRSIADNLTITQLKPFSRFGFISGRQQRAAAGSWMRQLSIRAEESRQFVADLSGGNQQKVALGRLLHHDARILLLDEPTRGIDVGSKAQVYQLIGELAAQGKAILFISSYLPELLGICDTIGVMSRGVLTEVRPAREWTEHAIIAAAVGQAAASN